MSNRRCRSRPRQMLPARTSRSNEIGSCARICELMVNADHSAAFLTGAQMRRHHRPTRRDLAWMIVSLACLSFSACEQNNSPSVPAESKATQLPQPAPGREAAPSREDVVKPKVDIASRQQLDPLAKEIIGTWKVESAMAAGARSALAEMATMVFERSKYTSYGPDDSVFVTGTWRCSTADSGPDHFDLYSSVPGVPGCYGFVEVSGDSMTLVYLSNEDGERPPSMDFDDAYKIVLSRAK